MVMALRALALTAAALALTACVSTRQQHGYVMERGETELDAQVGIDTRESVLARYGEPSIRPALSDDVWYYVTSGTNSRAFFETETIRRSVTAFAFDAEGHVAAVETYGMEDGQAIELVGRETPTRGKELSFIEQLMGGAGQIPGLPGGQQGQSQPGGPQ